MSLGGSTAPALDIALCLARHPGQDPAAIQACVLEHASPDKLGSIGSGSPNRLVYTREP